VNEPEPLQLVVLYDANHNAYSILAHNRSPEEAQRIVAEQTSAECSGCSVIVLDQLKRHRVGDAERCRACRERVKDAAHVTPQPQFTRRK
jgi:hypothetical protein